MSASSSWTRPVAVLAAALTCAIALAEAPKREPAGGVDAGASDAREAGAPDPKQQGEQLFTRQLCVACHSTDGSPRSAPSFKGLYGSTQKLRGGATIVVDDAYLRESILRPGTHIAEGYQPLMPAYAGRLSDAEVDALVAFIKSLR